MNLLMLLTAASAQEDESFDAHGLTIVPEDGDLRDGLITWRAENLSEKRGSIGLLVEYSDGNLVEYFEDLDGVTQTPLLDDMLAGHLRGTFAVSDRIGLGVVLPVVISSEGVSGAGGFGVGDARLAAPVGLLLPDEDGTGIGLSLVPYADLPIGDETRFLGDSGVSGGGLLALGAGFSRLQLNSNVGLDVSPSTSLTSWAGGTGVVAGLGASALISDGFALGVEGQARPLLSTSSVPGTHFPAEAVISGRGRAQGGLSWSVGAAVPLSNGATAARYRTFAGVGMSFGDDPGASLNIQVVDDGGQALPGATVQTNKGTLTTDGAGGVIFSDHRTGAEIDAMASLSGYESDRTSVTLVTGENSAILTLSALPSAVNLLVRTQDGTPIDATVALQGPEAKEPVGIGDDGTELIALPHGAWSLSLSAEGYSDAQREVSLKPGEEIPVEVVMRSDAPQQPEPEPVTIEPEPEPAPVVSDFDLPTVYFSFNSIRLDGQTQRQLRELVRDLQDNPGVKLKIVGHTDTRGDEDFNQGLGQLRANAVLDYLSEQGIDYKRLTATTSGEGQLASSGSSESDHAVNRRVSFQVR